MRRVVLILTLFLASCADKNEVQKDVDLKTQILMFAQKHKIDIDELNIVAILSYLNPTLDEESERDISILSFTPHLLEFHSLKVFINHREVQAEALKTNDEFLKCLINNSYTKYFRVYLPSFKKENFLKAKVCSLEFTCFELDFQRYPKSLHYHSKDADTQYN